MATFGITTIGGSTNSASSPRLQKFTAPEDGTITSISSYRQQSSSSSTIQSAIYDDDAGVPGNLLAISSDTVSVTTTAGWYTNVISCAVVSGSVYWIGSRVPNVSGSEFIFYTTGGTSQHSGTNSGTFTDPWDGTLGFFPLDGLMSVYATYTPAESGGAGRPTATGRLIATGRLTAGTRASATGRLAV